MITCLMPIRMGQILPADVLKGLSEQDISVQLLVEVDRVATGRASEAQTRNWLFEEAAGLDDDYFMMMDVDKVLTDPGTVRAAIDKVILSGQIVHIRMEPADEFFHEEHFDIGAVVLPRGVVERVRLDTSVNEERCCCARFSDALKGTDFSRVWLDDNSHGIHKGSE